VQVFISIGLGNGPLRCAIGRFMALLVDKGKNFRRPIMADSFRRREQGDKKGRRQADL
jgi:hypothetical protein